MATFFYESKWNLAGFTVLWLLRNRQRQKGNVFCWYLLIYGSGRFVIEQLRQDSLYVGGLRASQWLSLALCVAAALLLLWRAAEEKRHFGLGVACAAAWIARWFCFERPALYGVLLLTAGLAAIWLLRNRRTLWLLAAMLVVDAGGLLAAMGGGEMMTLLHAFVCSFTLPGLMIALCEK